MSYRCLVGSPYPNVDGTCVNEEGPDQGSIGSKFLRLLAPITAKDGKKSMPFRFLEIRLRSNFCTGFSFRVTGSEGKPLPSARRVAQLLRKHLPKLPVSALFKEWSHMVAADTISIPVSS